MTEERLQEIERLLANAIACAKQDGWPMADCEEALTEAIAEVWRLRKPESFFDEMTRLHGPPQFIIEMASQKPPEDSEPNPDIGP